MDRQSSRHTHLRRKSNRKVGEAEKIFFGRGYGLSGSHEFHHNLFSLRFKNGSEQKCLGQVARGATRGTGPKRAFEVKQGECAFRAFFDFGTRWVGGGKLSRPAIEIGLCRATFA